MLESCSRESSDSFVQISMCSLVLLKEITHSGPSPWALEQRPRSSNHPYLYFWQERKHPPPYQARKSAIPAIRFLTREAKWKAHQHMSATMTSSEESSLPDAWRLSVMIFSRPSIWGDGQTRPRRSSDSKEAGLHLDRSSRQAFHKCGLGPETPLAPAQIAPQNHGGSPQSALPHHKSYNWAAAVRRSKPWMVQVQDIAAGHFRIGIERVREPRYLSANEAKL